MVELLMRIKESKVWSAPPRAAAHAVQATADKLGLLTTILRAAIDDRVHSIIALLPEDLRLSMLKK